eukprot:gene21885-27961_t
MAIEDLDIAVELDPSSSHLYSRAVTYADFGKFESAIDDANSVPTRALLGRALKILNEHKKAEEQLTFAILLDDSQAALYTDFDRAVKLLESKLAFRNTNTADSVSSARNTIVVKNTRSPSIGNLSPTANTTVIPSVTISRFSGVASGGGSASAPAEGTSNFVLSLAAAVAGAALNKIEESEDGPEEVDEEVVANEAEETRLRTPPIMHRLIARLNSGSYSSVTAKPPLTRSGSVSSNISKEVNFSGGAAGNYSAAFYKELEEQLADTLFKRAQAKLMIETSATNVEAALSDAIKSSAYQSEDDDYQMVIATCYIRLNRFEDAIRVLQHVLDRSPNNFKALYNFSFCQRACGQQKNAIEGLTKIISCTQSQIQSMTSGVLSIPIHRVYEMRGTLFHEMQAHKLALSDLGKAIAINPSHADNYYLRGDCQCKLGNYEQALSDFNLAESKQFEDMCSLLVARGGCRRLLGDSAQAGNDFRQAYQLLEKTDKVGKVRILSFKAFCQIDEREFQMSHDSLIVALQFNSELVAEKISSNNLNYDKVNRIIHKHIMDKSDEWLEQKRKNRLQLSPLESDILYLKRIDWILNYHIALCLFMQNNFVEAEVALSGCGSEDALKFVPDDLSLGTQLYFLALSQIQLQKYHLADIHLQKCAETHWVDAKHNKFLYLYTSGKLCQSQGQHLAAIDKFTAAMALTPNNPYCHFKRAWSFKAVGEFVRAGEDFELAKQLRPDDPNFSVDYRRISACEYMVIGTEPDLTESFPPLLPVPGMAVN